MTKKDYSSYFAPSLELARKRRTQEIQYITFNLPNSYKTMGDGKTYMVKTYGCQGNLSDSEKICGIMDSMGFEEVFSEADADVLFFNTCAIRDNAEKRVFGELGRLKGLKKKRPGMLVCVCGCMSQEEEVVNKIKEKCDQVDIVFGTHNIHKIPDYLASAYQNNSRVLDVWSYEGDIVEDVPQKRISKTKAWVQIMYGCDEFCTYCIVPYTRGTERSREPEAIIEEVKRLKEEGFIEVTLLGQNVNAYGKDLKDRTYSFANLLRDLALTGIDRIRYTTSHPRDLDEDTMIVMSKYPNIMPHLHLPVQSGNNRVLKRMNRKYTREMYLEKVNMLKNYVPGIALTTDIIVAFPGESDEEFRDTLSLVEEAGFEGAYTFIYSPREGTPAAKMTDEFIDPLVAKARLLELNKLINEGFAKGNKRFEGTVQEVLVDGFSEKKDHLLTGYTKHNKLVNFEGDEELIGKLVNVKIIRAYTWHLLGELDNE